MFINNCFFCRLKDSYRDPAICVCGLHAFNSRTRIGMLNDRKRRALYFEVLRKVVNGDSVIVSLGDCSLMGLLAAALGAKKVSVFQNNNKFAIIL